MTAQDKYEFLHGLGYDFSFGFPQAYGGIVFQGNGLNYVPRIVSPINSDLSLGISLLIGASLVSSGEYGSPLGINYAAAIDIHSGFLGTRNSRNRFGAFFGLGFGSYDLYSLTNDVGRTRLDRSASYGPYAHFGLRTRYYGQNVSFVLSNWRSVNMSNGKMQVFSLKLIYEFND
jgi:hypothetical protein